MEYVDGEDLASLLRRIGRLPPDKALEIARELCAGLAAAHEQGVLHRDLKPANIMIDGRGRVRITDFGLAVGAEDVGRGEVAGTPAYMAPEQLAGEDASVRSDIYALGLVLYEMFTGQAGLRAASAGGMALLSTRSPDVAFELSPGIDPAVERVILRCLEKDPQGAAALGAAVAAALPGGDPLAAALAAGETPSPEMVAAAGAAKSMRPSDGVGCARRGDRRRSFLTAHPSRSRVGVAGARSPQKSPRSSPSDRGQDHPAAPATRRGRWNSALWFRHRLPNTSHGSEHDLSPGRWQDLASGSPGGYVLSGIGRAPVYSGSRFSNLSILPERVVSKDPSPSTSGMVSVPAGSGGPPTLHFRCRVPPQI